MEVNHLMFSKEILIPPEDELIKSKFVGILITNRVAKPPNHPILLISILFIQIDDSYG